MEKRKPIISTVTPCYNEEAAIPLFYQELRRVAEEMADAEFEFLFVEMCIRDRTYTMGKYWENQRRCIYNQVIAMKISGRKNPVCRMVGS